MGTARFHHPYFAQVVAADNREIFLLFAVAQELTHQRQVRMNLSLEAHYTGFYPF